MSAARILTMVLLLALLVLGAQRPTAAACAMDDPACQDHCALLASSCASACMVRLLPVPQLLPPPVAVATSIEFSVKLPVRAGVILAPDTAPPRTTV